MAWAPWALLAALLTLCAVHGVRMTAGLAVSPDVDSARDIGYAQGFLDGNFFGDPTYVGEWRFYPPLLPALRALAFRLSGASDLVLFWVQTGPWINLLVPLAFFGMARQLFGTAGAAAVSTAVLVLLNGALDKFWTVGGYTPWPSGPILGTALFFAVVWLIHARVGAARWRDAAMIGFCIGMAFLAHIVPAVILTAMVAACAFTAQGFRLRTLAWLALAAAVQLLVMSPYLFTVLFAYPGGTVHSSYEWVDPLFTPNRPMMSAVVILNTPGVVAAALAVALRRKMPMDRIAAVALAAWIVTCGAFMLRHYGCAGLAASGRAAPGGACDVFVIAVHHYHLYLQLAWAAVIGFVLWQFARRLSLGRDGAFSWPRAAVPLAFGVAALLAGGRALLHRDWDMKFRDEALLRPDETFLDTAVYRWALANTRPGDLFAADIPNEWQSPAGFAVMAAGRGLVSAPELFSHPYVDWRARESQRLRLIAAVTQIDAEPVPCDLAQRGLWFALSNDTEVRPERAELLLRATWHSVYRATPLACGSLPPR